MYYLFCIQVSLMMSCNSQASLQNPEQEDPPHSATLSPRTSPTINDDPVPLSPIMGLLNARISMVQKRAPPTDLDPSPSQDVPSIITIPDSPLSPIPSPRMNISPTGGEVSVLPVAHSTQPPQQPSEVESVQPISVVVEYASNLAIEVAKTDLPPEVQALLSAVNIIPLDYHNPKVTINAPQAIKRYLTRWPRSEKAPHPVFDNTEVHDFRTMHNNQDEDKWRAALAKVVPSHVNVSLLHPWLKVISSDLHISISTFSLLFPLSSRSFGFRVHNTR